MYIFIQGTGKNVSILLKVMIVIGIFQIIIGVVVLVRKEREKDALFESKIIIE
jgi:vacuolar-type H+-ATPase subunit I/STV1